MSVTAPHFLLFSEAAPAPEAGAAIGRWRFVLRSAAGQKLLEAADEEDETPERLELLAIVRGLESLDQPSRVTLVTASRNIHHGLRSGLAHWRESGWHWERFGKLAPVKNADLWRRIDRALDIHVIECRCTRIKPADDLNPPLPSAVGRRLRFDEPHAAEMTKDQAPNRKQARSTNEGMTETGIGLGHWSLVHWNLFEIWCLVLGAFSRLRSLIPFHSTT
jgi:ribonuclease HI